jgi:3',5'-cyclic AMP phosphodiesterase CpdA
MPIIFDRPDSRRAFLKTATLGGAAFVLAGCRTPGTPAAGNDTGFHLALLSDTHVPGDRKHGHRGFNPWENLQAVVPQVVAARPEGVVLCGDAARLEGKVEDYQELRALLEPVAAVAPVYIGLGNHDDRANFLKAFPARPGVPAQVNGKHVTVIEHPAVRVIVLDSLLYVNQVAGLLGQAQRAWLAAQLPRLNDRPVVLFIHHTLGDGDGDLLDAAKLFALVQPYRHVKAVCYGHSHVWELTRRDRLQLINLPAVGYNFSDPQPVGWVDALFDRGGVALTLRALAGNRAGDGQTTTLKWA